MNPILNAPAAINFLGLVKSFTAPVFWKTNPNQSAGPSVQLGLNVLNCRVKLKREEENNCASDVFTVEICGSIHAPSDMHCTIVRISLRDVTDGIHKAKPVHSRVKQWQIQDLPVFCYNTDLGKLPRQVTTLSDWMTVARMNSDWMIFPRKGKRKLRFDTLILSRQSGEELACATCTFTYRNNEFGYIDLQENIRRTKTLAVALAFAVSAADKKLFDCEVELIKNWARDNINISQASDKVKRKLEKALNRTLRFFRNGNQLDIYKICKEIAQIAPIAERYDILDLCLHVVRANGVATVEELALLKNLAKCLEVDPDRFRSMMGKILPASMHEVKDVEVILGVASDMSKEQTRQRLNKEYRKWNSRVTSFDPEIQSQADYMLKFIAEARTKYIG